MKITIEPAPRTPEVDQAIEDLWVSILRAALAQRAEEEREPTDASNTARSSAACDMPPARVHRAE